MNLVLGRIDLVMLFLFTVRVAEISCEENLTILIADKTEVAVNDSFEIKCIANKTEHDQNITLQEMTLSLNRGPGTGSKLILYSYDFSNNKEIPIRSHTKHLGVMQFSILNSPVDIGIKMVVKQAVCNNEGTYECDTMFSLWQEKTRKLIYVNSIPLDEKLVMTHDPEKLVLSMGGNLVTTCQSQVRRRRGDYDGIEWELKHTYWKASTAASYTHSTIKYGPQRKDCTKKVTGHFIIRNITADFFFVSCKNNNTKVVTTSNEVSAHEPLNRKHIKLSETMRGGKSELVCLVSVDPDPKILWYQVTDDGLKRVDGTFVFGDISRLALNSLNLEPNSEVEFMCVGKQTLERDYTANQTIKLIAHVHSTGTKLTQKLTHENPDDNADYILIGIFAGLCVFVMAFGSAIMFVKVLDMKDDDKNTDTGTIGKQERSRGSTMSEDSSDSYLVTSRNDVFQVHHVNSDPSVKAMRLKHEESQKDNFSTITLNEPTFVSVSSTIM